MRRRAYGVFGMCIKVDRLLAHALVSFGMHTAYSNKLRLKMNRVDTAVAGDWFFSLRHASCPRRSTSRGVGKGCVMRK